MTDQGRQRSVEALRCGHCGQTSRMTVVGSVTDAKRICPEDDAPYSEGDLYQIQRCANCQKLVLVCGYWNDQFDDPEGWNPEVVLPELADRTARTLLAQEELDRQCMQLAVEEARKCKSEDGRISPLVGAVVTRQNEIVAFAHRGENDAGEHAEYIALEGKSSSEVLAGATVYTTLEPCTVRNPPKVPCVTRLIQRRVARVVIGMLDPDERIRGRGILALREAGIRVDLFPPNLMAELEELNRNFISARSQPSTTAEPHFGNPNDNVTSEADRRAAVVEGLTKLLESLEPAYRMAVQNSTNSYDVKDSNLITWKYEAMKFLGDNFESDEVTPFSSCRTTETGAGPLVHLSSSFNAHREYLESLRTKVEDGRVQVRRRPRPSSTPLPRITTFTYR